MLRADRRHRLLPDDRFPPLTLKPRRRWWGMYPDPAYDWPPHDPPRWPDTPSGWVSAIMDPLGAFIWFWMKWTFIGFVVLLFVLLVAGI